MSAAISMLDLEPRAEVGRSNARALRRQGRACAVIYAGGAPARSASVNLIALNRLANSAGFRSRLLTLNLEGKKTLALPREIQRDPLTEAILHIDFLEVRSDAEVQVNAPVRFTNQEECRGLKRGGVLSVVRRTVEITCQANAIPDELVIDLLDFTIGDSIRISHTTLPEGVTPVISDRDFTIATIAAPRLAQADEDEAESDEAESDETEEDS